MNRIEENAHVVNTFIERAEALKQGTFEELTVFHLGTIASMLADISKSLAILADKAGSEDKE